MGCRGGMHLRCTHPLQTPDDRCPRVLNPQHLLEQPLTLADAQGEGSTQQRDQGTESGATAAHVHIRWQRRTGAGGAAGAHQPVQPVLNHQRRDRRDLDHLMPQRIRILAVQQRAAVAAGIRVVLHHLIHPLDRQQLRPSAGMARLAAALGATALTPCRRLKPRPVAGWGL